MSTSITQFNHLRIPLAEIQEATNNFSQENIIGRGDFGYIYQGQLLRSREVINVSAKRLDRSQGLGDVEFFTEVSVLSNLKHPNIVSLIGFCDEKDEKIIVNRDEAKRSLGMYLSDPALTWIHRLNISVGVASAISYLHYEEGRNYSIIHRNINSSTILLDDKFEPKLSGFEFSIKGSTDRTERFIPSEIIEVPGYMDPDTEKSGEVTQKSDIYSFGVVLCEMMCGRKAFLPDESQDNQFLVPLFRFHYDSETLQDIIHPDITNLAPDLLRVFAIEAYVCTIEDRQDRPDINWSLAFFKDETLNQEDLRKQLHPWATCFVGIHKFVKDMLITWLLQMMSEEEDRRWKVKNFEHLRISLIDIQLATNNFSKESTLETKRYYSVHKGDLNCFDREYASKRRYNNVRIKRINDKNAKAMFHKEIEVLSACKHDNIDSLLGFCEESGHMILVYEGNGTNQRLEVITLSNHSWLQRVIFCYYIAHGLNYIHNEMEDQKVVIHRQIRSDIMYLHNEHVIKISGFELSTFLSSNRDEETGDVILVEQNVLDPNNDCYMAPEFLETGKATKKSDIYSFGLVMVEIITGIPYYIYRKTDAGSSFDYGTIKQNLSRVIKEENRGNKLFLKKGPNQDSLDIFLKIAEKCLAVNPKQRPTLEVIIRELDKALSLHDNHKDHLRMSFKDIESATRNFSRANYIGAGGFGKVYRGELASEHGSSTIVAKRLDKHGGQGDQQFYNELHILSEYKHENVIRLVGYNNDEQERIVVYEYASRGSLDNYLNDASLTWINRLNICVDVARGLSFLHGGVREHEAVIHRDMKTANILLFDDWKAKVADFGLSLIYTKNEETDYVIDHVSGTPGYLDPVYQKSRFLTEESDIYSLGVVLLEILVGESTYQIKERENLFLQSLVKKRHEEGRLDEVVFNPIKNQIVPEALATFHAIAYQCLHDDRKKRPTAQHVVTQLQVALELQVKGVPRKA